MWGVVCVAHRVMASTVDSHFRGPGSLSWRPYHVNHVFHSRAPSHNRASQCKARSKVVPFRSQEAALDGVYLRYRPALQPALRRSNRAGRLQSYYILLALRLSAEPIIMRVLPTALFAVLVALLTAVDGSKLNVSSAVGTVVNEVSMGTFASRAVYTLH